MARINKNSTAIVNVNWCTSKQEILKVQSAFIFILAKLTYHPWVVLGVQQHIVFLFYDRTSFALFKFSCQFVSAGMEKIVQDNWNFNVHA